MTSYLPTPGTLLPVRETSQGLGLLGLPASPYLAVGPLGATPGGPSFPRMRP